MTPLPPHSKEKGFTPEDDQGEGSVGNPIDDKTMAEIMEILDECLVYFENKQDADYDYETGFIPNVEMVLASRIKQAIREA